MARRAKRVLLVAALLVVAIAALAYAAPASIEATRNRVLKRPPYAASESAQQLHRTLLIADLHTDSLLWGRDLSRRGRTGHVDLPRLAEGNVALQAFTVVTQAPRNLNISRNAADSDLIKALAIAEHWPPKTWSSLKQRALFQAARLRQVEKRSEGRFVIIRSASDLQQFLERHRAERIAGGFLGIEGAQALEGDLNNLDEFYAAGFRMMAPTHFTDTDIGGSAAGVQKSGLTAKGREWVRQMEARKMIIDLAHASPATIRDVTAMATRPVVVSHTGVKGTCNNNRNLSDSELQAVANTGGVIGIGYWETAICGKDARAIARAIRHAVKVAGVEHVVLGSDFDGSTTMPFDTTGLVQITDALLSEGFSEQEIRLIMGENTVRVLLRALPDK